MLLHFAGGSLTNTPLTHKHTHRPVLPHRGAVANTEALAINDAWAGHPGTLVKSYPGTGPSVPLTVDQTPCDGRPESLGWTIANGLLQAPAAAATATALARRCLGTASGPVGQTTQQESSPG